MQTIVGLFEAEKLTEGITCHAISEVTALQQILSSSMTLTTLSVWTQVPRHQLLGNNRAVLCHVSASPDARCSICLLQVGNGHWLRQHDAIERLNIQAHQSAQCRSDEYVVDALVTQQRLSHLVHELLVAEASLQLHTALLSVKH